MGSPFFVYNIFIIYKKQVNCLLDKYLLVVSINNNNNNNDL